MFFALLPLTTFLLSVNAAVLNSVRPVDGESTKRICSSEEADPRIAAICAVTEGCELVSTDGGPCFTSIKEGIKPRDIIASQNTSQEANLTTTLIFGNHTRTFGTTPASLQWHQSLYNLCNSDKICDLAGTGPSEYDNASGFNNDGLYVDSYIPITIQGSQFESWDQRNALIDAIVAASTQSQNWTTKQIQNETGYFFSEDFSAPIYQQLNISTNTGPNWWYAVSTIVVEENILATGWLAAVAQPAKYEQEEGGFFCDMLGPAMTDAVTAVNGAAGGLLGLIDLVACSDDSSPPTTSSSAS